MMFINYVELQGLSEARFTKKVAMGKPTVEILHKLNILPQGQQINFTMENPI